MPNPDLPPGPFPSPVVAEALGLAQSTIGTWAARGYFDHYDYGRGGRGKPMLMSLRDALATALLVYKVRCGIETVEMDALAAHRFAGLWMSSRGSAKAVNQLVLRFYGVPGSPDSKVSIAPNDEALSGPPPSPGARLTIRFDLDAIFLPLIAAMQASA